jgi:hypothetical protein
MAASAATSTGSVQAVSIPDWRLPITILFQAICTAQSPQSLCATDEEATLWIINNAVDELGNQVVRESDGVRLVDGLTFEKLRWQDKPIPPQAPDIHEKLRDPFNPQ